MRAGSVPYDRQGRGQEAQSAVGFPGVIDACKATTPPGKPTFRERPRLVRPILELSPHFAAWEVTGPGVHRRDSVVCVDVHIGIRASDLLEDFREGGRTRGRERARRVVPGFAVNVLTFVGSIVSSISTPSCRPVGPVVQR